MMCLGPARPLSVESLSHSTSTDAKPRDGKRVRAPREKEKATAGKLIFRKVNRSYGSATVSDPLASLAYGPRCSFGFGRGGPGL